MRTFSPAYAAHLQQRVTTLTTCWQIEKRNGDVIRGTSHDRSIPIETMNIGMASPSDFSLIGVYLASAGIIGSDIRSNSDGSVDNMEVQGALSAEQPTFWINGISAADLEAGLFDAARVTVFRVNWRDANDFQEIKRHGFVGEVAWTAEGQYTAEVRGLTQKLTQTIGRTCGERCDVKAFGDSRCKFPVETLRQTGVVTEVISRKKFKITLTNQSPPQEGECELGDAMPRDIQVGDSFTGLPDCDRRYETCKFVYGNLVNFRGPGIFLPGMDSVVAAPDASGASTVQRFFDLKNGTGANDPEVVSKREFIEALREAEENGEPPPPLPQNPSGPAFERYQGGQLTFTSGANAGYTRGIKIMDFSGD